MNIIRSIRGLLPCSMLVASACAETGEIKGRGAMETVGNIISVCQISEHMGVAEGASRSITVRGVMSLSPHGTGVYLEDPKCPTESLALAFDDHSSEQFRQVSAIYEQNNLPNIIGKYVVCICSGELKNKDATTMVVKSVDISIKEDFD